MQHCHRLLVKGLCVAIGLALAGILPASADDLRNVTTTGVQAGINEMDRHLSNGDTVDSRDLGYAAFAALLLHGDGAQAARFLEREIGAQLPDGRFVWTTGQRQVSDANAIDFAVQDWGIILLRYQSLLPASARSDLKQSAERAIPALIAHHVDSDYTNIALMNATDLVELGTALNNADAVSTGTARLRGVQQAFASHGIHEFTSPTYTAVQLMVLSDAYASLPQGAERNLVGDLLTALWSDIAPSAFDGRLAGAHSRDYSFVGTPSTIALFLAEHGLANAPHRYMGTYAAEDVLYDSSSGSAAYVIPQQILASGHQSQRWFTRPWGSQDGQTRSTFVDGRVAIGITNADYPGGQEKAIAADIAGIPGDISINAVNTGDPYGIAPGHKPEQLPLHPQISQHNGLVSGTIDVDLSKSSAQRIELSVLIPKAARVDVNGQRFDTSSPGTRQLKTGDVINVAGSDASVAFSFRSFSGATPSSFMLVADDAGLKAGAVRVTATYAQGDAHALASFVLLARNDDTAAKEVARLVSGHP